MSFAAKSFKSDQKRILQESCKFNKPEPRNDAKKNLLGKVTQKERVKKVVVGMSHLSVSLRQQSSAPAAAAGADILKRSLKSGPGNVTVRQTLTSKLRMEKANPLLTSSAAPAPALPQTPARRATFQPQGTLGRRGEAWRPASETRPAPRTTLAPHAAAAPRGKRQQKENVRPGVTPFAVSGKPLLQLPVGHKTIASHKTLPPLATSTATAGALKQTASKAKTLPWNARNSRFAVAAERPSSVMNKSKCSQKAIGGRPAAEQTIASRQLSRNASLSSLLSGSQKATTGAVSKKPVAKHSVTLRQATHMQSTVSIVDTPTLQLRSILRRSKSACNLEKDNRECEEEPLTAAHRSVNKSFKNVAFHSPLASPHVNTPPPSVLRKRLEDWLKKRGKSTYSYNHLCCFGLPKSQPVVLPPEELKLQVPRLDETITLESSDSTMVLSPGRDNLPDISAAPQSTSTPEQKTNAAHANPGEEELMQPGALRDVKQLINSGYPREQCEQWLLLIAQSHPSVRDSFLYWECLAALEEARGDLGSAVDCLGRAIERGADTALMDKRLDELWERFSALSTNCSDRHTPRTRASSRRTLDTKHIFKSTVIKFALQQRAVKRFTKETGVALPSVSYVVTPVRRSSRRSQSAFRSTPSLTCFSSLQELNPEVQRTMEFHGNAVLDLLDPGQ